MNGYHIFVSLKNRNIRDFQLYKRLNSIDRLSNRAFSIVRYLLTNNLTIILYTIKNSTTFTVEKRT